MPLFSGIHTYAMALLSPDGIIKTVHGHFIYFFLQPAYFTKMLHCAFLVIQKYEIQVNERIYSAFKVHNGNFTKIDLSLKIGQKYITLRLGSICITGCHYFIKQSNYPTTMHSSSAKTLCQVRNHSVYDICSDGPRKLIELRYQYTPNDTHFL